MFWLRCDNEITEKMKKPLLPIAETETDPTRCAVLCLTNLQRFFPIREASMEPVLRMMTGKKEKIKINASSLFSLLKFQIFNISKKTKDSLKPEGRVFIEVLMYLVI